MGLGVNFCDTKTPEMDISRRVDTGGIIFNPPLVKTRKSKNWKILGNIKTRTGKIWGIGEIIKPAPKAREKFWDLFGLFTRGKRLKTVSKTDRFG